VGAAVTYEQDAALLDLVDIVPAAVDWSGDGILDLLASTRSGEVYVLETAEGLLEPAFTAIYALSYRENGADVPIKHTLEQITPRFDVVDWDGDGLLDLLVAGESLAIYWYKAALAQGGSRILLPPSLLRFSDGSPLTFPVCTNSLQPVGLRVVDWDQDDDLDIALGLNECYYLQNVGTRLDPLFVKPARWDTDSWCREEGGSFHDYYLFSLSGHSVVPNVGDWNGDGSLDVLLGFAWRYSGETTTHGYVVMRLNHGTNRNPSFPDDAVRPWPKAQFLRTCPWCEPIEIGTYSTAYPVDINNDGWIDLLVGGDGALRLYVRTSNSRLELAWELEHSGSSKKP
jgi:hypothetical protein